MTTPSPPPTPGPAGRRAEEVADFIERFGAVLEEAGIPRMPARVFAALLTSDEGAMTAAELAEAVQASPAAISGAVRYLTQVHLLSRRRAPGTRRDLYVLYDGVWYEAMVRRDQLLATWISVMDDGIGALGSHTPASHRLAETRAFFEYLRGELPALLDRWRTERAERFG